MEDYQPVRRQKPNVAIQIVIIAAIVLGCMLISQVIGLALGMAITGEPLNAFTAVDYHKAGQGVIDALKVAQLFSVLGTFILPAIILPRIVFRSNFLQFSGINARSSFLLLVLAILSYFAFAPLLDLIIRMNQQMKLPGFLSGLEDSMKNMEETNGIITQRFLDMHSFGAFLSNVFLIALLPAIGEELFFRGFLQRSILLWTKKPNFSVILTGAIFSFIHMQFFGFFPRWFLGMLLGYLFLWSGDLKVSMTVHFLNNFMGVLMSFIAQQQNKPFDVDAADTHPIYMYVLSAIFGGVVLYYFYQLSRSRRQKLVDEAKEILDKNVKWIKVYATAQTYQAEIIKGNLENAGIPAVVINKRDSSYLNFGEAEIYVAETDAETAIELIPSYRV
jgi:hypothetical protein